MTAAVNNITIEQGATYRQLLTLKDGQVPPVAIDITGCTFRGSIKRAPGQDTLASFTFPDDAGSDLPEADPQLGQIYMVLTAAASAAIPVTGNSYKAANIFQYDVEMTDTNGNTFRIMNGTATISPEITTNE